MKYMKCRRYKKDEVLFADNEVMILLDGLVHMKSHADDVVPPKMLAKLQQGDIIGFSKVDNGCSQRVDTWCVAVQPTEVAIFNPQDFDVKLKFCKDFNSLSGLTTRTRQVK